MRNNLATRIEALEALPASVVSLSDNPLEKARRDKAMQALAERIADPHKAQREYAALSAAGRIDHWQGKITEASRYINESPFALWQWRPVDCEIPQPPLWRERDRALQQAINNHYVEPLA